MLQLGKIRSLIFTDEGITCESRGFKEIADELEKNMHQLLEEVMSLNSVFNSALRPSEGQRPILQR